MDCRQPEYNILVGARGHGKSTFGREEIVDKHPSGNALILKEGVNLEDQAFAGIPIIGRMSDYKGGHVIVDLGRVEYRDCLSTINKHVRNCLLFIDDAINYEGDTWTPEFKELVVNCRRMKVDVVAVYHGITTVPIRHFQYINNIILFHTTDKVDYKLSRVYAGPEIIERKERIKNVAMRGGKYKYYHEVIKLA